MAGVEMTHIPYRGGGPAVTNLLGGQAEVFFAPVSTAIQYIKADKLRALAVTGTRRFGELPDVPTAGDFVSGYEASYWIGLGAPKKSPGEIVTRLNKEINAALATPDMQSRFAQQGGIVAGGSPSDFEKFISDETQKWSKVIKTAPAEAGSCREAGENCRVTTFVFSPRSMLKMSLSGGVPASLRIWSGPSRRGDR
jgi:tripartite-type tricarboxylate transporter receptor subunit TctC